MKIMSVAASANSTRLWPLDRRPGIVLCAKLVLIILWPGLVSAQAGITPPAPGLRRLWFETGGGVVEAQILGSMMCDQSNYNIGVEIMTSGIKV
jgi:hypothetical protein